MNRQLTISILIATAVLLITVAAVGLSTVTVGAQVQSGGNLTSADVARIANDTITKILAKQLAFPITATIEPRRGCPA